MLQAINSFIFSYGRKRLTTIGLSIIQNLALIFIVTRPFIPLLCHLIGGLHSFHCVFRIGETVKGSVKMWSMMKSASFPPPKLTGNLSLSSWQFEL